jgi:hypothetical protein
VLVALVACTAVGNAAVGAAVTDRAGSAHPTSVPVSRLQVRVVTGFSDLAAGSIVELRIYELGKTPRHLALSHGESWPRDSTRLIPLTLAEPLDPRTVQRIGLYYRAASVSAPAWEVESAEVRLDGGEAIGPRLLDATLSGAIQGQGELGSDERDSASMTCASDADCDDHHECNGRERCAPRTAGADARGCVKGSPRVCPVNQVCAEGRGCVGLDAADAPAK